MLSKDSILFILTCKKKVKPCLGLLGCTGRSGQERAKTLEKCQMYGLILVAPSCMKGDMMNVHCGIPLPFLCWFGMEPREYLLAYVWQ